MKQRSPGLFLLRAVDDGSNGVSAAILELRNGLDGCVAGKNFLGLLDLNRTRHI
jgi:hypothetical protein